MQLLGAVDGVLGDALRPRCTPGRCVWLSIMRSRADNAGESIELVREGKVFMRSSNCKQNKVQHFLFNCLLVHSHTVQSRPSRIFQCVNEAIKWLAKRKLRFGHANGS